MIKCYEIEHKGEYLTGYSIVFAYSIEEAKDIFLNKNRWLAPVPEIYGIKEIEIKPGIHVIFGGDY